MDTWPTDKTQFDSLLASNNELELTDIEALPYNLRGFHPVEYLIFGEHGRKKAADLTARQKKYMVSATIDIVNICNSLNKAGQTRPSILRNKLKLQATAAPFIQQTRIVYCNGWCNARYLRRSWRRKNERTV